MRPTSLNSQGAAGQFGRSASLMEEIERSKSADINQFSVRQMTGFDFKNSTFSSVDEGDEDQGTDDSKDDDSGDDVSEEDKSSGSSAGGSDEESEAQAEAKVKALQNKPKQAKNKANIADL
jgi:hypothetical protein